VQLEERALKKDVKDMISQVEVKLMERLADGSSSIIVGEDRLNSFTGSDIIKEAS
jgi:hypothetical protein